eukprot:Skav229294  [mRNA]  locus=scaffold544:120404:122368:+ [translate_table: standard]
MVALTLSTSCNISKISAPFWNRSCACFSFAMADNMEWHFEEAFSQLQEAFQGMAPMLLGHPMQRHPFQYAPKRARPETSPSPSRDDVIAPDAGCAPHPPVDGPAPAEAGNGSQPTQNPRFVCDVFVEGRQGPHPHSDDCGTNLADSTGPDLEATRSSTPEGHPGSHCFPGTAQSSSENWSGPTNGSPHCPDDPPRNHVEGPDDPVSEVEPNDEAAGASPHPTFPEHEGNHPEPGGTCGTLQVSEQCDPISCPAIDKGKQGGDVEAPTSNDGRGTPEALGPDVQQRNLHAGSCPTEDTCSQSLEPGDLPGQGSQHIQGERQGEGQDQGPDRAAAQGSQAPQGHELQLSRTHVQHELQQLILLNQSTLCYANSAFQMIVWTLASFETSEVATLQIGDTPLLQILRTTEPMNLADCCWFQTLMQNWQGGGGEADASEFAHRLLRSLNCPGVTHCWEKRLYDDSELGIAEPMDHGDQHALITLQFPENTPQHASIPLESLITAWNQDWGLRSALLSVSKAVVLHIDRFMQDSQNQVYKTNAAISEFENCLIPYFLTHNVVLEYCYYDLVSIMVHTGDDQHGHYRTLVRLQPMPHLEHASQWALLDDNKPMQLLPSLPEWVGHHAVMLGFVRSDELALADQAPRGTADLSHLLHLLTVP